MFFSCTKEINIEYNANEAKQFVVNGYIENDSVPRILLQRSLPYFDPIDLDNKFFNSLINDATVTITTSSGASETLSLVQNDSPPYGNIGFADTWFYNYEGSGYIVGQEGMSYRLDIEKDDTLLWAVATIPKLAAINSDDLRFLYRADDSAYCYLIGSLNDPDTIGNCYRAFSYTESPKYGPDLFFMPMLEQDGNYNDEYINGWTDFSFPMYKGRGFWQEWGEQENEENDNNEVDGSSGATTGFWNIGDIVTVKWSSVDRGSWDFWASLQYNNPGGPFGSPAQAQSNINGGLGVFGGSSSQYIKDLVANPEDN
tara:strand:- start:230 stop:1168 length:939 start_codon:yes stop_codon:yes gene_type:complete